MLNSAHFKVTEDEFNKIASLIEKISASPLKFEFKRAKDQEGSPLDQI